MRRRQGLRVVGSPPETSRGGLAEWARSLSELGLPTSESRIYLTLLERPLSTAANLARVAGVPRPKVYEALRLLEERGFCVDAGGRVSRFRPIAAAEALPAWVSLRDAERRQLAEREQALAQELVRSLPAPDPEPPDELHHLEAITGRARTTDALERLIGAAERSLDMMQQPPFLQPRARWNVAEAAAAARGARVRILYTSEAIADPARYRDVVAAGAAVRVRSSLPMKMLVRDGEEAMISLRDPVTGEQGTTSALVRHPDLVHALALLFQREWRQAQQLEKERE